MPYITDPQEMANWLTQYASVKGTCCITNSEITVSGSISLSGLMHSELPVKFATINGDFRIDYCPQLETLQGCPEKITGSFTVGHCGITTMLGGPREVSNCTIYETQLRNLEGSPQILKKLECSGETITSLQGAAPVVDTVILTSMGIRHLDGAPPTVKRLEISQCKQLESLRGCPAAAGLALRITDARKLDSLIGICQDLKSLSCTKSGLMRLEGLGKVEDIDVTNCGRLRTLQHLQQPVKSLYARGCHQLKVDHRVSINELTVEHLELPPLETLRLILQDQPTLNVTRKNRLYHYYQCYLKSGDYIELLTQLQRWPHYHELAEGTDMPAPTETFSL